MGSWEKRFVELHRLMAHAEFVAPRIHLVAMRCAKAEVALERAGWTIEDGAEEWKPPVNHTAREHVQKIWALESELKSARDEMNRQACLYAEASRHRAELKTEVKALRSALQFYNIASPYFGEEVNDD